MRTVGRRWPRSARGQAAASCDYCGAAWQSGALVRDADGLWACPDDLGRTRAELDQANAAAARRPRKRQAPATHLFDDLGLPDVVLTDADGRTLLDGNGEPLTP